MSHLNEHGITHLRHVDLAVPDYETQRTFYRDTWGLTEEGKDGDLSYFAAEGSPEQYIVRLRQSDEKRLDLIAFGMTDAAAVDAFAERRWDDAEAGFRKVMETWPDDPPCRRYLEEIREFRVQPPPPQWDGVYTATTK